MYLYHMDKQIQILLGSQKNIDSVNVDTFERVSLFNDVSEITEYDINEEINATDQFNTEREENEIYRIYGRIEWMSLLNGLINNYKYFEDFFTPSYDNQSKNIINSFNFYLVRPAETGFTKINNGELIRANGINKYIRCFQVVATPADFEIFPIGFSKNVYGEQTYCFNFKKDFDISTYFDEFLFPNTELFLYAQYKKTINGNNISEILKYTKWNADGSTVINELIPTNLNVDDFVKTNIDDKICDVIEYDIENYTQTQLTGQTFYITTQCKLEDNSSIDLVWKYNPFIPIRLRYLGDELYDANTGSTTYDIVSSIPEYAIKIDDDGNYVWREVLPEGYIDPLTGIGTDHPFLNGRRYVFIPLILSISPDLNDDTTKTAFNEIWYTKNISSKNIIPKDDLDKIGKPCQ